MGEGRINGPPMNICSPVRIELGEFTPFLLPEENMSHGAAEILWKNYGTQVSLEYPSPKTNWCWSLTSNGWVGYNTLTE
jgi:5-methylcytosine-specific restriction enzyme subunit McrC